jgi:single-strand DNA-binding protein
MAGEPFITLVGNVGNDPEIRFTPAGVAVCNFNIANTERKQVNDAWVDGRTNWFKVSVWRSAGEAAAETIRKGDRVMVVGRLSFSQYEKDGEMRVVPEITAESVAVVPKGVPKKTAERVQDEDSPW